MNPENPTGSSPVATPRAFGDSGDSPKKPSRHDLENAFLSALYEDFAGHGAEVIGTLRTTRPASYLRAILLLLPNETEKAESAFDAIGDDELDSLVAAARTTRAILAAQEDDEPDRGQSPEILPSVQ